MLFNEDIFSTLLRGSSRLERGASSHWKDCLAGFEFRDGKFTSTALPEGGGLQRKSWLHSVAHATLQLPFRLQGLRYAAYRDFLDSARRLHGNRGTAIDIGTLRQALTMALLEDRVGIRALRSPIVVIGDGFGVFASLVVASRGRGIGKVVLVNLTPNLLVDAVYLEKGICDVRMCLVESPGDYRKALDDGRVDVILVQADNAALIGVGPIGLAVNIVSMQEMELDVVREYFDAIRRSTNADTYFYCCNREEKTLSGGSVIRFRDYPWDTRDDVLLDELCPWQQYYYDRRFPFYHRYDGRISHRLVLMHKANDA